MTSNGFTSVAIVSGKGGSGKTMLAATIARTVDSSPGALRTLLIDADYGTAGLSYYMGLNTVPNISVGLTNLQESASVAEDLSKFCQPMKGFENAKFLAVGDHKRYLQRSTANFKEKMAFFEALMDSCRSSFDCVLVDCRGGIDIDSLAVCAAADKILIVVETDTTSFQATQHLVEVLYDNRLSHKISGFVINKVFDDPSTIARSGTASFKSQYLNSVPFDLDATKSFLLGDLPSKDGMFALQAGIAVEKVIPSVKAPPWARPLSFRDYRRLSVRDSSSVAGGMFLSFLSLACATGLYLSFLNFISLSNVIAQALLATLTFVAVSSGIEPFRRAIGRMVGAYLNMFERVFSGGR